VGFTAGFIAWVLRSGSLLASMMSALPFINRFDPLPIAKSRKNTRRKNDENHDNKLSPESSVDSLVSSTDSKYS
ncbi:MAG: hypothetical protein GY784_13235, partial [Gammaproteobacteria bacterium]|nr:hypothetical protein [Gammaproteobacteria bacterium]